MTSIRPFYVVLLTTLEDGTKSEIDAPDYTRARVDNLEGAAIFPTAQSDWGTITHIAAALYAERDTTWGEPVSVTRKVLGANHPPPSIPETTLLRHLHITLEGLRMIYTTTQSTKILKAYYLTFGCAELECPQFTVELTQGRETDEDRLWIRVTPTIPDWVEQAKKGADLSYSKCGSEQSCIALLCANNNWYGWTELLQPITHAAHRKLTEHREMLDRALKEACT
jgi:hypothetical protein